MKLSIQFLLCVLFLSACITNNPPASEASNAPVSNADNLSSGATDLSSNQRQATKEEVELILKGKIRSKSGSEKALSKEDIKKILKGEYKNPDNETLKLNKEDVEQILKGK